MRTPRPCCARSLYIGREEGRARGCHNEGMPRIRQARRRAVRRLLLPGRPGTSPSVPVSFDKAKSFRVDGARTHPRAREWDSLLLVAWKAPAGVLGNGAMSVARKFEDLCPRITNGHLDTRLTRLMPMLFPPLATRSLAKPSREAALPARARAKPEGQGVRWVPRAGGLRTRVTTSCAGRTACRRRSRRR